MSPQLLLGLGVGLPLLAIAGYVAWLARRVGDLETRGDEQPADDGDDGREGAHAGQG